jgi:hypothetical protein
MNSIKRHRWTLSAFSLTVAILFVTGLGPEARGGSVVQFMTAKSLPDATVAVIDPESGTSSGTSGSDVNIAVGDIILFRFAVAGAPSSSAAAMRGIQAYVTEYVPPGTQVVGARLIDSSGNTIEPRPAGLALDGCAGGNQCNNAPAGLQTGSIAQVYADTGIFFSTGALSGSPIPNNQFLTLDNGIPMNDTPSAIDPQIVQVLNDTNGPWNAHNDWDFDQLTAFGTANSPIANGDGNTPHGYGSPVAGPQTHYQFEVNANGTLTGVVGPWQRMIYPGSQIGSGVGNIGSTSNMTRVGVETATGSDVTPASPRNATAVRFALGEAHVGEVRYVEVALRVLSVPIDPTFGTGGGNVDCGEVFGSDQSSASANTGGSTSPWPYFVPHPQCVFLRLKFDLAVDKVVAAGGQTLNYAITGKNLATTTETNARVIGKFVSADQSLISTTPAPSSTAACASPDTDKTCLTFNLGSVPPSGEYSVNVALTASGSGKRTNTVLAQYLSNELAAIDPKGFTSTALTVVLATQLPQIVLSNLLDDTANFAAAGSNTWAVTGAVINAGNDNWTSDTFTIVLPAATWGLRNAAGTAANQITVGGNNATCTTTGIERVCTRSDTYTPGQSRVVGFRVVVPAGQPTGLYTFGIRTFGMGFETNNPKAVVVPVGASRTVKPVINCPIGSTATAITGTSVASSAIEVLFNLITRGTGTATAGGTWSVSNYTGFGELYGGLEVRATATAPGKLKSIPSNSCTVVTVKQCSDGIDNDGDGFIDFPADIGCTSPGDNSETNPVFAQCQDGVDNDGDLLRDYPLDPQCTNPSDNSENGGLFQCNDGLDNDGDTQIDLADADCGGSSNGREVTLMACQDGLDNDGDGLRDYPADLGCHSLFDDDEFDTGSSTLDTKARLLLALDSSGSMNMNTCADTFTGGDGTTQCPGNDIACATCASGTCGNVEPDDSRLYQVTSGLSNVDAAFGEVEYSLMRFHQRATDFGCPTAAASLRAGGWQGGGASPCGGGFAAGDLLVSFAPNNEATILTWMDHDSDYVGVPPIGTDYEIRGSGTTPLAGILTSANTYMDATRDADPKRACRPYRVILVTDGAETCGGTPTTVAATLLSNGIPVYVIGFSTPDPVVISNLNAIAVAGGTTGAIFVDDEAALSDAIADIIADSILFETCNGDDDDCDTLVDEDFPDLDDACDNGQRGECYAPGVMVCSANGQTTVCNAPPVTPGVEVCNGLDDDCDGFIDDGLGSSCTCNPAQEICNDRDDDCDGNVDEGTLPGVGNSCGTTIGECDPGTIVCTDGDLVCQNADGPVVESCNSLDDDCDTFVDEIVAPCYEFTTGCDLTTGNCEGICGIGSQGCDGNQLGECVGDVGPGTEACNGVDDDCDGTVDDGFNLGATCNNGGVGACFATGQIVCNASGGTTCTAPTVLPGIEVCNGVDDDCDGFIDEPADLGPPIGNACGAGGACGVGEFECIDGEIVCVGSQTGTAETCNNADDDCDSTVDEDVPGEGDECVPVGFEPYQDFGECEFGHTVCTAGDITCEGYIGPTQEIPCNGIDEDCDNEDDQTCPGAQACLEDACRNACMPGEFPCPLDFVCEVTPGGSFCVPDPCADVNCAPGFECDPDLDPPACVDLCDSVTCSTGSECVNGLCQDCFNFGCAEGEICVRNEDTMFGECTTDLCANVVCDTGEFCRDGTCIAESCDPTCDDGQICLEGECLDDPCMGHCVEGELCNPDTGECHEDECVERHCDPGEACNPFDGECIPDPCLQIDCGTGFECVVLPDGSGTCFNPPPKPTETVFAGGGGCDTGGSSSGLGGLALVALSLVWVRRRRRA